MRAPPLTLGQTVRLAVIDGTLLGLFMVSVGVFVSLIASPQSPLGLESLPIVFQRALIGAAMGLTAFALISSPLGARSGAHMNPATTLAYLRLGRIPGPTAVLYVVMQVGLGILGAWTIGVLIGPMFTDAPVMYAPTRPGPLGSAAALLAEFAMAFVLFTVALFATNSPRFARHTPKLIGLLVFAYITLEAPLSGMSINPARTLASAVPSGVFDSLWVYLVGPPLGMLAAAEVYVRLHGPHAVHCCKLNHESHEQCPFCGCDGPINFSAHGGEAK